MNEFCPLCRKLGYYKKITPVQINFQEAVWLCESEKCPWPFGYEEFKFIPRDFKELSKKPAVKADTQKNKEQSSISAELSLYTPPVTPSADGSSKDSMKSENSSSRSPGTNNGKNSPNYGSKTIAMSPKYSVRELSRNRKNSNSNDDIPKPVLRSIFDIDTSTVESSTYQPDAKMQRIESNTCDTRIRCSGKSDQLVIKNEVVKSENSGIQMCKVQVTNMDKRTLGEFDGNSKNNKILVFKQREPNKNEFVIKMVPNGQIQPMNVKSTFPEMPSQFNSQKTNTIEEVPKIISKSTNQQSSIDFDFSLRQSAVKQELQSKNLLSSNVMESCSNIEKKFQVRMNSDPIEQIPSESLKNFPELNNEFMNGNNSMNASTASFDFTNSMLDDMIGISSNVTQEIDDEWLNLF